MPIISVIVPVYNVEKYLVRCLESIVAQSFQDYECILIDDGSPDNCPAICDQYVKKDKRFRTIHQSNHGLSSARNTGISHSTGEWICFVDSDDFIHPDYLKILYLVAKKYAADVVSCKYEIIHEDDELTEEINVQKPVVEYIKTGKEVFELHYKKGMFSFNVWDKIYKKDIITHYFPVGLYHEDQYFNTHILPFCNCVISISNNIYRYRLRCTSITGNPLL